MANRSTTLGLLVRQNSAEAILKIKDAIRTERGVIAAAARKLGVSDDQLRRYIKRFDLGPVLASVRDRESAGQ